MQNSKLQFKNAITFLIISFVLFPATTLGADDNGATLFLLPGNYSYFVGEVFSVSVKLDTGGRSINAAESLIEFPSEKLEVKEISTENSIFDIWPREPFYSNEEGFISFGGGLPTPGFNGSSGTILTILFEAKKEGRANVDFSQGRVLADDGLGTNVLENTIGGFYSYKKGLEAPVDFGAEEITWLMEFWISILAVICLGTTIAYLIFRFLKKPKKEESL
jgi:hypothetical protein